MIDDDTPLSEHEAARGLREYGLPVRHARRRWTLGSLAAFIAEETT